MGAKYKKDDYVKDLKTDKKAKIINVYESKNQNNGRPYYFVEWAPGLGCYREERFLTNY